MLHDIARNWSAPELFEYMRRHGLAISPAEREAPTLAHARIGAHIARERFGVDDPQMLLAIERHTVAVPGMSDIEKILYIADTIEPSRRFAKRADAAAAADRSLDEGLRACVNCSLEYLASRRIAAAPQTLALVKDLERCGEA